MNDEKQETIVPVEKIAYAHPDHSDQLCIDARKKPGEAGLSHVCREIGSLATDWYVGAIRDAITTDRKRCREAWEAEMAELERRNANQRYTIKQSDDLVFKLEAEMAGVKKYNAEQRKRIEGQAVEIERLECELADREAKVERQRKELGGLHGQIEDMKDDHAKVKKYWDECIDAWRKDNRANEVKIKELLAEVKKMQGAAAFGEKFEAAKRTHIGEQVEYTGTPEKAERRSYHIVASEIRSLEAFRCEAALRYSIEHSVVSLKSCVDRADQLIAALAKDGEDNGEV